MATVLLEARGISKQFPGVKALERVNFDLRAGEVHALLGENGAGKSTLMKILSGVHQADEGSLKLKGREVHFASPRAAMNAGIGTIYQELNLCRHLSVAENIFLGRELCRAGKLSRNEMNERSAEILRSLNCNLNPAAKTYKLPISQMQIVEIAKVLSMDAEIIIMDEPTSSLTENETEELFRIIRLLKAKGKAVIYISHRLEELAHIADRITVLRDGRFVVTQNYADTTLDEIIRQMVGRDLQEKYPHLEMERGREVLQIRNFSCKKMLRNINFVLHAGEITGFAGLMGAGRTELAKALFGFYGGCGGEIILNGKKIMNRTPHGAIANGIVYIPEDRKHEGLAVNMTVSQNVALPVLEQVCSKILAIINRSKVRGLAENIREKFKLKTPSFSSRMRTLSGGNQQKVVIGKWLAKNPLVYIFDEPTRGIDVNAKIEIYKIINQLKSEGKAIMFISSELPEIIGMSDRIVVMCNGEIRGELRRSDATQEKIMEYATKFR